MADPFLPFLLDCSISAQGLIFLGWGGLAVMNPTCNSPIPASPVLDASPETIKVLSVLSMSLGFYYIQSVYQSNRTFMFWSVMTRLVMTVIMFSNGQDWKIAGFLEGALGILTAICLRLESMETGTRRTR